MFELFQSTPDLVNRENKQSIDWDGIHLEFQSTPDLVNRENNHSAKVGGDTISFNPLPI